jgi:predicted MPP superfamily phosphohydrolase
MNLLRRINPFIAILLTVLVSGYLYVGSQLILPFDFSRAPALFAWLVFALPFAAMLWLPLIYWQKDDPAASRWDDRMLWAAYFSMGLLSFLLLFVALRDLLLLAARAWGSLHGAFSSAGFIGGATGAVSGWAGGPSRVPMFLLDGRGSLLILFLAFTSLAIGFWEARRNPEVTRIELPVPGLPESLAGLRIAQISDLHIGSTIQKPFVERVVATLNSLDADLIALTGDLVDGTVKQLAPHFEPLRGLRARLGRYYVTGNHEYYWEAQAWIDHVRELGITPLLNSHVVVECGQGRSGDGGSGDGGSERSGARVVVAGVLDLWAARSAEGAVGSDPKAALAGAPADAAFRILLAHQPKTALAASTMGYDLQLSGHTHGGQFLPWTVAVKWFQPHSRGLHRIGRMWLYVNRGTGYWGPPVRLGSPSEITLITLVRA